MNYGDRYPIYRFPSYHHIKVRQTAIATMVRKARQNGLYYTPFYKEVVNPISYGL